MDTNSKVDHLKRGLSKRKSALIAFSGGVDSSLLLYFAKKNITGKVLAVTCISPLFKAMEIENSKKIAQELNADQMIIEINELKNPDIIKNDKLRCYYCKKDLFLRLKEIAEKENIEDVFDGSNYDDLNDYRPGMLAIKELEIKSPLLEAGLTKKEIRQIIRREGLSFWDMEALACLGSRFPYGKKLKKEALKRIDEAEDFLMDLGLRKVRVRHYGNMAKIEMDPEDILKAVVLKEKIISFLKKKGYSHIAIDLEGYRMGSLNNGLKLKGEKIDQY